MQCEYGAADQTWKRRRQVVSERRMARPVAAPNTHSHTRGNRTTPVSCQWVTRWPICFAPLCSAGRRDCWCPQITGPVPHRLLGGRVGARATATASPAEDQTLISPTLVSPLVWLRGCRASSAEKSVPSAGSRDESRTARIQTGFEGWRVCLSISTRARVWLVFCAREDLAESTEEPIKTRTTEDGVSGEGWWEPSGAPRYSLIFFGLAERKPRTVHADEHVYAPLRSSLFQPCYIIW